MMKKTIIGIILLVILASCTVATTQVPLTSPTPPLSASPQGAIIENCQPMPYTIPTLPATIPGYTQLDESIGLHITGSYQIIDPETYRLKVSGKVKQADGTYL